MPRGRFRYGRGAWRCECPHCGGPRWPEYPGYESEEPTVESLAREVEALRRDVDRLTDQLDDRE
ncbi:hypothetical protein ACFQH6_00730 [Halobacteriaceae archaeon GCM10025711]